MSQRARHAAFRADLGLAPRYFLASIEEGDELSEDERKRKPELVVATADAIRGGVDR